MKLSYIFKRIVSMNYGNMFKTIGMVHDINHKNRIGIFFDWLKCARKYGAGYVDYYQFRMFDMNDDERKTIITRGINNDIVKRFNDKSKIYIFEDKALFNKLFDKYTPSDLVTQIRICLDNDVKDLSVRTITKEMTKIFGNNVFKRSHGVRLIDLHTVRDLIEEKYNILPEDRIDYCEFEED